ncbi:hypothetical protein BCR33DRAFT_111009 [Rhizoclosmatium globosum]|uniref:Uncharacterized protein n=1 Tax=Rhizoclosmatium globosum TaxID=329046 RepID=A0A1Y2CIW9_9FUNG|nr:hypothetical protein BCR33DRAFT_111009 [Rhizoclosmatium globosum]|eukprot:ORY46857.1 hypothetical protein BCR33DRAFT_111009 [Rhizoclosmatium globosum]
MTYTSYLNQFLVKKQVPDAKLSDNMMRLSKPRDNGGGMDPPIIPRVYTEDWKPSSRAGERKQKKGGKQDARSDTPQVGTIKEIESKLEWTKLPKDAGKGKLGKATETKVPDKGQKKAANTGNNKMSALQKESGVRKGAVGLSSKRVTLPKIASKSQGIVAKLGQEKPSNQLVQAQYQWLLQQVQKGAGNGAKMDAKFKTNTANDKGATAGSKLPPHLVAANFRITHVPVVTMKPIIVVETAGHPAGHYHDSLTTFISMAGGTGKSEKPFRSKK